MTISIPLSDDFAQNFNREKKHILIIGLGIFDDHVGGISAYQTNLTRQLIARGYRVSVLIPKTDPARPDVMETAQGVRIYRFDPRHKTGLPYLGTLINVQNTVRKILSTEKIDLLNIHFALSAWGVLKLKEVQKIPKVMCFHGPWPEEWKAEQEAKKNTLPLYKYPIYSLQTAIEKEVVKQMDDLIFMSKAFVPHVKEKYGVSPEKIHVIPIGWDQEALQPLELSKAACRERLNLPANQKILLTVRRLVKRTGVDMLIEAIAPLCTDNPDLMLYIGGKGTEKEDLEALTRQLGIEKQVRFLGYIPDEQLPLYYRAADLSCVPTRSLEGFGTIILESLIQGTPVIATPVGGMVDILENWSPQLLTGDVSVKALREKIKSGLSGELILPEEQVCRDLVTKSYHWDSLFPRIETIFRKHWYDTAQKHPGEQKQV